jgi:hypothetical protein
VERRRATGVVDMEEAADYGDLSDLQSALPAGSYKF